MSQEYRWFMGKDYVNGACYQDKKAKWNSQGVR